MAYPHVNMLFFPENIRFTGYQLVGGIHHAGNHIGHAAGGKGGMLTSFKNDNFTVFVF